MTIGSCKRGKKRCEVCDVFLRLTHFVVLLKVRVLKLIISLIVKINVLCISPPISYVINSTRVKLPTALDLGGIFLLAGYCLDI